MVKKRSVKKTTVKTKPKSKTKIAKSAKPKSKNARKEAFSDTGIVIVDDDIEIDQEKVNEERRAYLEEARSQEVSD